MIGTRLIPMHGTRLLLQAFELDFEDALAGGWPQDWKPRIVEPSRRYIADVGLCLIDHDRPVCAFAHARQSRAKLRNCHLCLWPIGTQRPPMGYPTVNSYDYCTNGKTEERKLSLRRVTRFGLWRHQRSSKNITAVRKPAVTVHYYIPLAQYYPPADHASPENQGS